MSSVKICTNTELWPIDKVTPYYRNIKKHLDTQVNRLADAILAFGWDQAIVVDNDGVIIKGHCRLAAAKKLNLTEVPVIVRSDLSSDKIKASRIADNKLAESEWDIDNLKLELDDLGDIDFNIELTGFSDFIPDLPSDNDLKNTTSKIRLIITFENEADQQDLFLELRDRGFKVKA